jgi:hypothetical protein
LGSHRDVHARLGDGIIGQAGLATVLRHPGLSSTAVLLETPIKEHAPEQPDWAHDARHLALAFELADRTPPDAPLATAPLTEPALPDAMPADSPSADAAPAAKTPRRRQRAKEPAAAAPRKRTPPTA